MAAIPGHIRDEVVIIGCHRDGECRLTPCVSFTYVLQPGSWELPIPPVGPSPCMKLFAALEHCSRVDGSLSGQVGFLCSETYYPDLTDPF
jgi:hypothetical protein